MTTITIDDVIMDINVQDEVIIYPGGKIKSRLLSIKDKVTKIASKVFKVVKETVHKIMLSKITKFFLKALVLVGYWALCFGAGYLLGWLLVAFLTASSVGMAILWLLAFLSCLNVTIQLVLLPLRLQ